MVRAKFLCKSKAFSHFEATDDAGNGTKFFVIEFEPVNKCSNPVPNVDTEDEDSIFGKFTPGGSLTLVVIGDAARHFHPGNCYYADFSAVG
jgi:hypothetical protein